MKNRLIITLICILPYIHLMATPPASLSGWEMVFNDEFDGNSLDKSKWNPTYNWGHTHNHRAYCVEENISVSDGKLIIKGEAKRHPEAPATCSNGGKTYSLDYTAGAIDTQHKFKIRYGYIEGRFKMPWQLGTWPAFWMLQDGWPPEIDIFEVPHSRNQHHYYLHYTQPDWYDSHGDAWDHEASFGGVHNGPDKSADFHNYGLEWNENYMNFYFDDQLIASYNRPREISQTEAMYIIINLAIGGWATDNGNPIEVTANNPAYLECDWVRVWEKHPSAEIPKGNLRFYSVSDKKCLVANDNDITLGDCNTANAIASLTESGNSYRINFGEKVLEIPNEAKTAGDAVGLWGWNGKAHQLLNLNKLTEYEGWVVSMRFAHSGHYVQTSNNDVIQNGYPEENATIAHWRILSEGEEPTSTSYTKKSTSYKISCSYNQITISGAIEDIKEVAIFDLLGRLIIKTSDTSSLWLPERGIYIIVLNLKNGEYLQEKIECL